ncbi:MAG: polysaccharide biosynthesis protein [Clostridia bacterium]|nr:polysaccharide biosynthesis protein [Clostridia bacterium]
MGGICLLHKSRSYEQVKVFSLPKLLLIMVLDIISIGVSYLCGLLVRFDFKFSSIPEKYIAEYKRVILVWCAICVVVFLCCKLYNSIWSFVSTEEVFRVAGAYLVLGIMSILAVSLKLLDLPRSVYVVGLIFSFACTIGIRFAYRFLRIIYRQVWVAGRADKREVSNVMIIGAGESGRALLQEFSTSTYLYDRVVCFIDDNPIKKGKRLGGVPIVGSRNDIPDAVKQYRIKKIIYAIPSGTAQTRKEILDICATTNCQVQVLPGMYQLVNKEVSVSKIRKVDAQDLLGRDPIQVNEKDILDYISGKVVLVTGGGGSIGSELCRQIARANPKQLVIFDIYENNAYEIQMDLRRNHPKLNLEVMIGSVRDKKRLEQIFERFHPEIVFHAAAHKHVPLMEDSPNEAIKNNVFGTYKTAKTAAEYGVKRFVLISTDKAVNPTNIMGASKRLCEMVVQMMNRESATEFVAVRFGNVLGSNGSVIPLFKKQIEAGGPVTVTHPDIIRYFMTIPEAVGLVLQAGAYAKGGEIFVLDMGEPVKIDTMARNLIRLSGYEPDVDIEVRYTGLRPGEKLYEELLMKEEGMQDTDNKLIHIGKPIEMNDERFKEQLLRLEKAYREETSDMKEIVSEIVPTYRITPNA